MRSAYELFSRDGYDGVSTKAISDHAGANIAAIFYHFGSKEDLLQALVENFAAREKEAIKTHLRPAKTREEVPLRLEIYFDSMVQFHIENAGIFLILTKLPEALGKRHDEILSTHVQFMQDAIYGFLVDATKSGFLKKDRHLRLTTHALVGCILSPLSAPKIPEFLPELNLTIEKNRVAWISRLVSIFIHSLSV